MQLMNIRFLSLVLLLTTSVFSKTTVAQLEFPEDKVSWSFSVEQNGDEATIIGKVTIVKHWHIYGAYLPKESYLIPTKVELTPSPSFQLSGKLTEPKPTFEHDDITDEDLLYHSNTIYLKQKIKVTSEKDFTIKGKFSFQTCDDSHCLPPHEADFSVKVKGVKAETSIVAPVENTVDPVDIIEQEIMPDSKPDSNKSDVEEPKKEKSKRSLITIFFLAFLSGFAALLTPCVFPMIPMTVSFFTKTSKTKAAGIKNAMFYGISIIVIYVLLGTLVTWLFGSDALNALSTNVWFNVIFFILLAVFAVSFMGAFEIRLPNSWLNKADKASDKGGIIGIFFMALALALVSFSCTGPIVGTLLVESATIGGAGPFVGMLGFSLALALPFTLFAAFPGWINSLPKSGGWLNTTKVVLGFLELALAFKFLSNADLVVQGHYLERELFLAIWIGIFLTLALYLFGKITLPHDSPIEKLSVGRTLLGTTTIVFVIYLIPGLWGAPLKVISGFPPPMSYSESPLGFGSTGESIHADNEDMHLGEHGIMLFHDMDKGIAYAKKVGKPVLLDFTGYACVNCRRMESTVWGEPGILGKLKNDVVMISLYVDDKTMLPKDEQIEVNITDTRKTVLTNYGSKWSYIQATRYKTNTQPYYRMLGPEGEDLENGSADYDNHKQPEVFQKWLQQGLDLYKEAKK